MEDCLFCRMIKGEVPCVKVYEDNDFLAFEDIMPTNPGHTLLIPKEHSEDILAMDDNLNSKALKIAKNIGNAMLEGLEANGFNIWINTKSGSGQMVFHTHIHIIPRFKNDGLKNWRQRKATEEDMVISAQKIIKALD